MHPRRTLSATLVPVILASAALPLARGSWAQDERVMIPPDTVVRLRLDDSLGTYDSRVGDRFTSTLAAADRSGFPEGTRFDGTVTEVQRRSTDRPGMLDMEVRRATLPDGQRVDLRGRLTSLADDDIRRGDDGRPVARRSTSTRRPDWKWAGIGAAGGAVLASVFGGSILKGVLLGGVGGAVYGYLNGRRDRESYREVDLPRNTQYGVRLEDAVVFNRQSGYRYTARPLPYDERYADRRPEDRDRDDDRDPRDPVDPRDRRPGDDDGARPNDDRRPGEDRIPVREELRLSDVVVRVNGRTVRFDEQRPHNLNGQLYVPLAPIAEEAGLRLTHRPGARTFTLALASGRVDGRVGDPRVSITDRDDLDLQDAPVSLDGEIYVPAEFLDRAAGFRTRWDREALRLDLDEQR